MLGGEAELDCHLFSPHSMILSRTSSRTLAGGGMSYLADPRQNSRRNLVGTLPRVTPARSLAHHPGPSSCSKVLHELPAPSSGQRKRLGGGRAPQGALHTRKGRERTSAQGCRRKPGEDRGGGQEEEGEESRAARHKLRSATQDAFTSHPTRLVWLEMASRGIPPLRKKIFDQSF